jgi:hypothetical protein
MTMRSTWVRGIMAFATAGLALVACAPGGPKPTTAATYRWVYSTGGIAGRRITPQDQHLSVVYSFVSDSTLFIVKNGTVDTTRYHITKGAGTAGRDLIRYRRPVNVLPPFDTLQYYQKVGRDTLLLSDRCADCYTHTFVRASYY